MATSTSTRRLGGLLDTYLRKRLHRSIHPALTVVRDEGEATVTFLRPPEDESPNALVVRTQGSVVPTRAASDDENHDSEGDSNIDSDDNEDDTFSLEVIYKDATREKQRFELAMEAYESTTAGSRFKTDVTEKPVHTWDDVLAEVQRASDTYYDESGKWGKIRKGLRGFGRNSKAFEAWASLLPSGSEYFSVLCGGLKLIFGAAARLEDMRTDIADALAEIPELLKCTQLAMGIFKRSKELQQASAALYSAIIAVLHHIVVWYREKAMKTLFKSILKQESYARQLDDLLKDVRQQSDRFKEAAQLCSYERIVTTSLMVHTQGIQQSDNHRELVGYLDKSSNDFRSFRGEFQSKAGDLEGELRQVKTQVTELTNILAAFLSSDSRMNARTQGPRGPNLPIRRAKSDSRLIGDVPRVKDALVTAFDYDDSVVQADLTAGLRCVWQIPRTDQDRLVFAMKDPKLQRWITETRSSALFLSFNAPRNRQSTSFIAAKLADSVLGLKDRNPTGPPSTIVLSFFCGAHSRADDLDSGVDGMLRSLIGQLLLSYPYFSLDVVRQIIQTADLGSVQDLCKAFYLLVSQLPREGMVVFCILDGVTVFEEKDRRQCEDCEMVVRELADVVAWTAEYGCVFKLLLTSPGNSRVLYRCLSQPEEDSVWLPGRVPPQGGFTGGKWEGSIGRDMSKLSV